MKGLRMFRYLALDAEKALVGEVIRRRIEGIRLRDPSMIASTVKVGFYTKFDDWTPKLQEGSEALKEEEAALKVLSSYNYKMRDLRIEVHGGCAWASFYLDYEGAIRGSRFNVQSRVSMFLLEEGGEWRIVHEHFSIMPKELPIQTMPEEERFQAKAQAEKPVLDELDETILAVLGDGIERSAREITISIVELKGRPVEAADVVERCRRLLAIGLIKQTKGGLYPKYVIVRKGDFKNAVV
ncbi:MAG: nuclear transport factor 2 family protein [Candidatus Bathyarchaeia archaeon]